MRRGCTQLVWTLAGAFVIFRVASAAAHPRPAADAFCGLRQSGGGLGLVALLVFKTSVAPNPC